MARKRSPGKRASVLREIRPGTQRKTNDGDDLTCLVLASGGGEWAGVDLSSGAIVRNRRIGETKESPLLETKCLDVVSITLFNDGEPIDPSRPEAISVRSVSVQSRQLRKRTVRKLLQKLCVPEIEYAAILSARGPSIAYVDLDIRTPSIAVIEISPKETEVMTEDETVVMSLTWSSTTQVLPVVDSHLTGIAQRAAPRSLSGAQLIQELSMKPGYAVVGLLPVKDGHAKKAVLSLLPR